MSKRSQTHGNIAEFDFGVCRICRVKLTKEYEFVSFCGDCAEEVFEIIFSNKDSGKHLKN